MRLLVSNPSILIALEKLGLLELLFSLPMQINTTDLLYEREFKDDGGQKLLQLGLQIQPLSSKITTLATQYSRTILTLCRDEAYSLALAQEQSFVLITINPELVKLAEAEGVHYQPLSSIFKLIHGQKLITPRVFMQKISSIAQITQCPLIKKEAELYLSRFT